MRCLFLLISGATMALSLPNTSHAQERLQVPTYREVGVEEAPAARDELLDFLERYREAWSNEDTKVFIDLHTQDTEWINAYARMFSDASSLSEFLETRLFPAFKPGVSRREAENMQMISLRVLGDDAAILHLYTDGDRGPSSISSRALRRTHFHLVLSRRAEGWKVEHTAIMDARE